MLVQNLQREIIFLICESICPHCQNLYEDWQAMDHMGEIPPPPAAVERRQTIFSLSLVCKRWGYIAQKVLHHHFGFFETHPMAEFLFCRTLSGNPELGKHVKKARLTPITTYCWSLDEEWLVKSMDKFSGVLDFQELSSVPDRGAFIAPLILLQVPTLDQLWVQNEDLSRIMRTFRTVFLGNQCIVPRSLTTLHVAPWNNNAYRTGASLDLSEAVMGRLLSASRGIRDLTLFNPNPQSLRNRLHLSNLRALTLYAAFSREELRLFLSSTGPLEKFNYYELSHSDINGVTPQDLCELLIPKKYSLTKLRLETSEESRHFTAAKHLTNVREMGLLFSGFWSPTDAEPILEKHALLDIFPPNLFVLRLYISENTILGVLDALVNYILSTVRDPPAEQKLRYVFIWVQTDVDSEASEFPLATNRSVWEEIKKRCKSFLRHGRIIMFLTCWKTRRGSLVSD
ncbi:hypothetical protein FBULB1_10835 [Fusarium bulbicola]|nr:hypothetical protein FBULB1_10835 [Fusarium bulbicola]